MKTRDWFCLISFFLSLTLPANAQTPSRYTLTVLPLWLDTNDQVAYTDHGGGINGKRVVGYQIVHAGKLSDARASLWQWGHPLRQLDTTPLTPDDPHSSLTSSLMATALNSRGDVVGYSYYTFSGAYSGRGGTAFLLRAGQTTKLSGYFPTAGAADLTGFPGDTDSSAIGINDRGEIVGNLSYNTHSPPNPDDTPPAIAGTHAYLRRGRQIKLLWPGFARGINNAGKIVGTYQFHDDTERKRDRGVLWHNDHMTFLPKKMQPMAINDRGWIAGTIPITDETGRACVWKHGHVTQLSAQVSRAYALNNRGEIVGETGSGAPNRATLWRRGHAYDLNRTVHLPKHGVLKSAIGINELGWIIGEGSVCKSLKDKQPLKSFTFLLTPTDEPLTKKQYSK